MEIVLQHFTSMTKRKKQYKPIKRIQILKALQTLKTYENFIQKQYNMFLNEEMIVFQDEYYYTVTLQVIRELQGIVKDDLLKDEKYQEEDIANKYLEIIDQKYYTFCEDWYEIKPSCLIYKKVMSILENN